MTAKDFNEQTKTFIDVMEFYLQTQYESNRELMQKIGKIVYKEILQEAILNDLPIFKFDKEDMFFHYIRTSDIDDKLHSKIIRIIEKSEKYSDIYKELKNMGYQIPFDIVII